MASPSETSNTGWLLWGGGIAALVALIVFAVLARSASKDKKEDRSADEWKAYLYPDRADLSESGRQHLGTFPTLDDCRAALTRHADFDESKSGWECAVGCRTDSAGDETCRDAIRHPAR